MTYVNLMWNKNRLRHIDISKVEFVGEKTCKDLQGLHAFSSCYSISACCRGGGGNPCSKAGYEGGRLKKAMIGVGKLGLRVRLIP